MELPKDFLMQFTVQRDVSYRNYYMRLGLLLLKVMNVFQV